MKNVPYISVVLLAAVMSLGGCKKDEQSGEPKPKPKPLRNMQAQPVQFVTQQDGTRGMPINDAADLTDMGIYYVSTGVADWESTTVYPAADKKHWKMTKAAGSNAWKYAGDSVYWATGKQSFFAYTPYETGTGSSGNGITTEAHESAGAGRPALTYQTPTDVTRQPDLMVAVPRYNLTPTRTPVELEMKHALTCVGFQVKGNGEKIKAISIEGVAVKGKMAIDGSNIVWTTSATPTLINNVAINCAPGSYYTCRPIMSTNLIAGNGYLMMIPQTLNSATAKVVITLNSGKTKTIKLSGKWEPGKKVTYTIDMGNMTISPMRVHTWGNGGSSYYFSSGMVKMWNTRVNFGTDATSTVKIEWYNAANTFNYLHVGSTHPTHTLPWIIQLNPDVVITGYSFNTSDNQTVQYILNYLKSGGVLILCTQDTELPRLLFKLMYPSSTITTGKFTKLNYLTINTNDNGITNGPFGAINGKNWGLDKSDGVWVTLPENDLVVYSRYTNNAPVMFRHRTYNLFFIGDETPFFAGGPFRLIGNNQPTAHNNWGGVSIENSRLCANLIAWAVKQAENR